MKRAYVVTLEAIDLLQTLDALSLRAEAWEGTAAYTRGELCDEPCITPEMSSNEHEAEAIALHYRDIIKRIEAQMA